MKMKKFDEVGRDLIDLCAKCAQKSICNHTQKILQNKALALYSRKLRRMIFKCDDFCS